MNKPKPKRSLREAIKEHPAVEDVFSEHGNMEPDLDDWWVHLSPGWINKDLGAHLIHEQTLQECMEALQKFVVPCLCGDCSPEAEK